MKLLLHTCCAPCSGAIVETLLKEGVRPTIYYCNPNIYPYEEYLKRKDECSRYAAECGLDMVDADYNHETWLQCVHGLEDEPERGLRCSACFRHRLLSSAQYALAHGFDTLATTLASSRWKDLSQVNAAGAWAVAQANEAAAAVQALVWWDRDWRKGGLQERRNQIIREKGFYNQLWCGCEFSIR
ncbi:MAG: epoxyqueuosine reductase QueH [Bacteroidales bacterium]|nr:epoxyqueuosine reductase QueH [Bacteroidales bacterium]